MYIMNTEGLKTCALSGNYQTPGHQVKMIIKKNLDVTCIINWQSLSLCVLG